jgi:micrococcal nuclease
MKQLFLILAFAALASAEWITGTAHKVHDGDTFRVEKSNGEVVKIRVYGIDAPETNQEHGKEAGDALRQLIDGKTVLVRVENIDRYQRTVGEPFIVRGKDTVNISLWMLRSGNAWWFSGFSKNRTDFEAAERAARAEKLGLWTARNPTPPWEFRKKK